MAHNESHSQQRVLITDAAERSMVATCRGLHAGGYEVAAAAFAPLAPVHWSRYCSERLRVTDPRVNATGFVDDLRRRLERRGYAALIPGSDFSLLAVSRGREVLEPLTQLGLPPHDVVLRSLDREVLAQAAEAAGLSPVETVRCADEAQAVEVARDLGYPVLLKSISTVREIGAAVARAPDTRRVADEQALRAAVPSFGGTVLVQRSVSGRTLSFGGVIAQELLGAAVSEYRRTWPPSAGSVAFSMTIEPPAGLPERVATLLRFVGWEGIFELEFIQESDGTLTPIDLNPRPYGSMSLAVASGANLPALWCDWVLRRRGDVAGEGLPATSGSERHRVARSKPGRPYRWEEADLRHLAWLLRRGHFAAAARLMRPWPRAVHPHFKVSDPMPLVARAAWLAKYMLNPRRTPAHRP